MGTDQNEKLKTTKRNDTSEMKRRAIYGQVLPEPLIHKLSTTNYHQSAHSATQNIPPTTTYGHVKKPNQKGTESTSQVKYAKKEKSK
jgi:hypothetical protein